MFEFDFEKRVKEIGKEVFTKAMEAAEKEVRENQLSFDKAIASYITIAYYASLEANQEILKEYHQQLMHHLASK